MKIKRSIQFWGTKWILQLLFVGCFILLNIPIHSIYQISKMKQVVFFCEMLTWTSVILYIFMASKALTIFSKVYLLMRYIQAM